MKASLLATFAAALLVPAISSRAQPDPTPYVETTTLTIYWGFASTYITAPGTTVPTVPNEGTLDPENLPADDYTYTDTSTVRAYTGPSVGSFPAAGGQQFIIDRLLQRMVRDGELPKEALGGRWELIAVREAPRNVHELATNPYRIFLSNRNFSTLNIIVKPYSTEEITDDLLAEFGPAFYPTEIDTGMTLTLGQTTGSFTEQDFDGDVVTNAAGSVSTAFEFNFGARFYEDPRHNVEKPGEEPDRKTYHLRRDLWTATASGIINYKLRSIRGEFPTFIATSVRATGTGSYRHEHTEIKVSEKDDVISVDEILRYPTSFSSSGLAPLRLTMSTIQYQKRTAFFPSAPTNLRATYPDGGAPTVSLTWDNFSFDANQIVVQRKESGSDTWTELAVLDAFLDPQPYQDDTVAVDTTYQYRVQAVGQNGPSTFTAPVTITTTEVP